MKAKTFTKHKEIKRDKPMEVKLIRYNSESDYTDGMFFIDDKFICYSIEDEERTKKVWGETCIPTGKAQIKLRKEGRFHNSYIKKFPEMHKGMLCITNKPNWKLENKGLSFQYILIHIGNDDDDTAGCPLTGLTAHATKGQIDRSTDAYKILYPIIANELVNGGEGDVQINFMPIPALLTQLIIHSAALPVPPPFIRIRMPDSPKPSVGFMHL